MKKGIIYYTDNKLGDPIFSIVQKEILKSHIPIVSVSLSPISFGENIVLENLKPNIVTMIKQITIALENSDSDFVFFCEHDVLYPLSHFEFTPDKDNIYYYNSNVWRWDYPKNRLINYDRLISLSGLCVNRKFALDHYKSRLNKIIEMHWDEDTRRHEADWARKWGYEPGTKKIIRGGFSDDEFEMWRSKEPLIDIRHSNTFSPPKVRIESFRHPPTNFREITLEELRGWNLKKMFGLVML